MTNRIKASKQGVKVVEDAIRETQNIITKFPYDGLDGAIPSWLPEDHKQKFNAERERLLEFMFSFCNLDPDQLIINGIEESQVKEIAYKQLNYFERARGMMNLFDGQKDLPNKYTNIPREIRETVEYFCLVREANAEEMKNGTGLEILIGKSLAKDARRGAKVLKGTQYAHECAHGTPEEKKARWKNIFDECLRVAKEHPEWGLTTIRETAAEHCGVSLRTVERHTEELGNLLAKSK